MKLIKSLIQLKLKWTSAYSYITVYQGWKKGNVFSYCYTNQTEIHVYSLYGFIARSMLMCAGINMLQYGNRAAQSITSYGTQIRTGQASERGMANKEARTLSASERQNLKSKQRMLIESKNAIQNLTVDGKKVYKGQSANSILAGSQSYANALSTSRTKAKDTALKLKKLRYDFKGISSQIVRSKTSSSARLAVSKAKREVVRLKRLQGNSEYDDEELQAAISHAKSMERVAKKKVRHLLEEEMVKVSGGKCLGDLEEKEDLQNEEEQDAFNAEDVLNGENEDLFSENPEEEWFGDDLTYGILANANNQDFENPMAQILEAFQDKMANLMDSMSDLTAEMAESSVSDLMDSMMEEMWDSLGELMEDMGLDDLTEDLIASADAEMDPADYKMMKIKHRCKEMKDMAEADGEYLKAIFDQLQKQLHGAAENALKGMNAPQSGGMGFANSFPTGASFSSSVSEEASISPDVVSTGSASVASMPVSTGGFDVSI